jgi:hypothetical protein
VLCGGSVPTEITFYNKGSGFVKVQKGAETAPFFRWLYNLIINEKGSHTG